MMERKCAYCMEVLRDGATVCHVCARLQPDAVAARNYKWFLYSILGVIIVGGAIWFSSYAVDQRQRSQAVERIVECAHLHGDTQMTSDLVNSEIDDGMVQTGKGWRAGAEYAGLVFTKSGLADVGSCFISQQGLFSD